MHPKNSWQNLIDNIDEVRLILSTLSNAKRLRILYTLLNQEMSAGALAIATRLTHSAISQHLGVLVNRGIVSRQQQAKHIIYQVASPSIELMLTALSNMYMGENDESRNAETPVQTSFATSNSRSVS